MVISTIDMLRLSIFFVSELFNLSVVETKPSTNYIEFIKSQPSVLNNKSITEQEAYHLKVDTNANIIQITASADAGAFYAIQTIRQLSTSARNGVRVPHADVNDQPRFEYRGMHVDVGRNFKSKSEILRLLDAMALYKLNKFHFHLTEDEGWRVEIPGLEELTSVNY